jgi:hypothetical protein
VNELTRLWFVLGGNGSDGLAGSALALRNRPVAGRACAAEPASRAAAASLVAPDAPSFVELYDLTSPDAATTLRTLDDLAARHADLEVLVVAPPAALTAALAAALDLTGEPAPRVRLRPGSLFAFDWPTGRGEGVRPLLIGADLDWLPPWTRGRTHARYPGGPGAAGTARG